MIETYLEFIDLCCEQEQEQEQEQKQKQEHEHELHDMRYH